MDIDIEQEIKDILSDPEKRSEFMKYDEFDTSAKKFTDAQYEIVFSVECSVFEKNEKQENASIKKIHNANYHMPIVNKSGQNIDEYISSFLKHFEKSLVNAASEVKNG